jgi:hypothetical protein
MKSAKNLLRTIYENIRNNFTYHRVGGLFYGPLEIYCFYFFSSGVPSIMKFPDWIILVCLFNHSECCILYCSIFTDPHRYRQLDWRIGRGNFP